ncbi:MAG: META domain-containing protein [Tidjanibacter sp.]|nr:META domain-containing protein [Tidjanibacter sp.]
MKRVITIITIIAMTVLGYSCCNCRKGVQRNHRPLGTTTWNLTQIEGQNVAELLSEQKVPTIIFDTEGGVGGYAGCNSYGGQYKIVPSEVEYQKDIVGKLSFGAMFATKRFCPNDKIELRYLSLLDKIDSFTIEENKLYLFTNGELKLVYTAAE